MQMKTINWEAEYKRDIESGIGFDITNTTAIDTKTKKKTDDGIFSPFYGGEEVESATELYTCECKALKGKFYKGIVCEECGTPVEYHNNDISKTGWMCLNEYSLINPLFYNILVKAIGNKNLLNIIKYSKEIDCDGNIVTNMDDYDEENPYFSLGMVEFEQKFDEIMEFYKPMKKDKAKYFKFIEDNRDKIFVHHIPVFSLILRPVMIIQNNVVYADINRKYALLLSYIDALNRNDTEIDNKMIKVLPTLYETQTVLNEIHNMIITMVSGKKGHIRSSLMGKSLAHIKLF